MSHPHLVFPNASESARLSRIAHHGDIVQVTDAMTLPTSGICLINSAATTAKALVLPAPVFGDKLVITMESIGTAGTFVATAPTGVHIVTNADLTATTHILTFNAAADSIELRYLSENHWLIMANTSVAVS
jgi:hypothetical protein